MRGSGPETRHHSRVEPKTGTAKRDEPQDRQQDATSLRPGCGASRQGGERPRRRKASDAWQRRTEDGGPERRGSSLSVHSTGDHRDRTHPRPGSGSRSHVGGSGRDCREAARSIEACRWRGQQPGPSHERRRKRSAEAEVFGPETKRRAESVYRPAGERRQRERRVFLKWSEVVEGEACNAAGAEGARETSKSRRNHDLLQSKSPTRSWRRAGKAKRPASASNDSEGACEDVDTTRSATTGLGQARPHETR